MRLEFKSCAENERFARQVAAAFVAELNPTLDEICDIKTAISEAVTNAIIHGYQNQDGIVTLSANYIGNTVEISVEDKGIGIDDVDRAREPLYTSQPELERSGMGFTVMESFMDFVDVVSVPGEGTKVIMRKTIAKDGEKMAGAGKTIGMTIGE